MKRRNLFLALAGLGATPAFALYEPKPDDALSAVQGEWRGSLTYRDYSEPKRLVTLPTRLFVALSAPGELTLHYVFNDGPSKTVYSYEKMSFGFAERQVAWSSGREAASSICNITSDTTADTTAGSVRSLVFERQDDGRMKRFSMALSARTLTLAQDEVSPEGVATFRNRFDSRGLPKRPPAVWQAPRKRRTWPLPPAR